MQKIVDAHKAVPLLLDMIGTFLMEQDAVLVAAVVLYELTTFVETMVLSHV
jgi:hypothetical protein